MMRELAGAVMLVTAACRRGSATTPHDTPTTEQTLPPVRHVTPSAEATSTPELTQTPPATPSATPADTPRPEPQILYRGGFSADPTSHDFNANLYCGGDPSLFSGLLTMNTDLTPMGDWAETWESNADASIWTFHLRRHNSGWSNGKPVTAHDFVWSWQRLLDTKTKAPHAWLLFDVVNAEQIHARQADPASLGAQAMDDWTLRVNLVGPRVYFPSIVATVGTAPAYQQAVESFGDKWTDTGNCVSNGPFVLSEWQHGSRWTTELNAGHWNFGNVRLTETQVPISPLAKHQQPYFNGQVDFMPVAAEDLANVRSIADFSGQLIGSVDPAVWFIIVNASVPPFDNQRVRQAVAHAIDRSRLEQLSDGRASAAHSLLPSNFPQRSEDEEVKNLQQFDVDQSLQLLSLTDHANGVNWPPVTLLTAENNEVAQLLAGDCMQQLFENLGMNVEVKTVSPDEYDDAIAGKSAALYWHRRDFTYADANNGYSDGLFPAGASQSLLPQPPAGLADLVGRGKAEKNPDARAAIYRDCEKALQTTVSYMPIAYPVTFYLIKPWVNGFPLVGDSSVLQPNLIFTRLTSLVSIKGRPLG